MGKIKYEDDLKGYGIAADDRGATIVSFSDREAAEIHIPAMYNGVPVRKIGFGAFQGCRGLERVFLPQSVNEIGNDAFWCSNDITIYAPAGSYAETYAKENNISFVAE